MDLHEPGGGDHRHRRVGHRRERRDRRYHGHAGECQRHHDADGGRATADAFVDCRDASESDDPDGGAQQFTANGTYSDSSTQNLTGQVTWASSSTAVATFGAGGLATGVSAGTTTISATLNGVSGITGLTVQAAPLPINLVYFSTVGNTNPPGVLGTADNADIYSWNGTSFARVLDVSVVGVLLIANVDGLTVQGGIYYLSFADLTTIRSVSYDDEDIVAYDPSANAWSLYFDGTARGLGTSANLDIDAFDIAGGILYFSTIGNTNPPGVSGTADDADVYSWNGATLARVLDVSTVGVPLTANVDGLTVKGGVYYLSFAADLTTIRSGAYQDEDIVAYDPATDTWSLYFDGTAPGLGTSSNLDIDAIQVP